MLSIILTTKVEIKSRATVKKSMQKSTDDGILSATIKRSLDGGPKLRPR